MLFMIIERFKNGDAGAVGRRFKERGRMMPDGVVYVSSWMDPAAMRCFQVMESPSVDLLNEWMGHWADLVDFEVVPVMTSGEFWTTRSGG